MDSLKGAINNLPPPLVSVFLVVFYLLVTQGLWYGIKNMFQDSYARMMTLELIAAAELTACFAEFQPAAAIRDALSVFVFTLVWMIVLAWFEIHWLLHIPNPCIRLENMIKKEFSITTATLLIFMELFGGIIGYGSMLLLSRIVRTPSECVSPLTVTTHEGLLYTCLGALVCRITSSIFSNTDSTAHRNIKKTIEIMARLAAREDQLQAISKHTRQHRDHDQQVHAFEILDQPEILYPEGEEEELTDINMSNEQFQKAQQAMNIDQRQLSNFITESMKDQTNGDEKRDRILINGGGGTGKTFLMPLLSGARITGGIYNPLLISAMYPYCTSIMSLLDFILVYWVGAVLASVIVSLTGLIALIIDVTG